MRVPLKWLKAFVDIDLSPQELAHRLTMAGLEVEAIHEVGSGWDQVFVGRVLTVAKHPDADRLRLAEVEAGEHQLTVVTGAPNIAQDQRVALALAGARLIDGHSDTGELRTLKPTNMRGVRSEGMVCSEKELGLSDEHEGILELPHDAPVGAPLKDYLGDTVLEFEITPNLVHAFSIYGIAREVSAILGRDVGRPSSVDFRSMAPVDPHLVNVDAPDLCDRYIGVAIEGLEVGPSPQWMVSRLQHAGLRPINNIVDVTNYVMLELGQPLHAFDRNGLAGGRIIVRRGGQDEVLETLDHVQRQLTPDMLVIADEQGAIGLAGVIGGVNSEVNDETTSIILEGANFNMTSVRRTSRALKLRTDASARFERGLDPELDGIAIARAVELMLELCSNARITGYIDYYPSPPAPRSLSMPYREIERVLGVDYAQDQILETLSRLEFEPTIQPSQDGNDDTLIVTIPTYRQDVTIAADIVEEVARVIGYETLPATLPFGRTAEVQRDPMFQLQRALRRFLAGAGLTEAVTYVTVSEEMLALFATGESDFAGLTRSVPLGSAIRLKNPLQAERPILRTNLVPSLLEAVSANLRHSSSVRLFELARHYFATDPDSLPEERNMLAIVMAGSREPLSRYGQTGELDFFDLKGVVEEALGRAQLPPLAFERWKHSSLHPGRTSRICIEGTLVGVIGEIRPDIAARSGIDDVRVTIAEIDLDEVLALIPERRLGVVAPKYLPVEQDFAVVVSKDVPAAQVEKALTAGAGPLLTGIHLFDLYEGPQLGEGRKSLAYRLTFTAPDRALTDQELVKVRSRVEKTLRKQVDGALRT
jgi:phenylalanyl-tRNA synthetase beta chain